MTFSYRDLALLPMLGILTAIGLLAGVEAIARCVMPIQLVNACEIVPMVRFQPNCRSTIKIAEGPLTTQQYNDCGYRSAQSCLNRPANNFRVAVLGTSISQGFAVPYDDSYAARAERDLASRCHRPVDVQTVGAAWPTSPADPAASLFVEQSREILGLKPAVLLIFVSSWDLFKYNEGETARQPSASSQAEGAGVFGQIHSLISDVTARIRTIREQSRFVLMARSILYRDDAYFLKSYLGKAEDSDFLRWPLSRAWRARLDMLERVLAPLDQDARASGTHIALVYVPMTEASVLIARGEMADQRLDPYALQRGLASIAERHHWSLIDTLADYAGAPRSELDFYLADGHPNANGHRIIADSIVSAIGAPGPLNCRQPASFAGPFGTLRANQ